MRRAGLLAAALAWPLAAPALPLSPTAQPQPLSAEAQPQPQPLSAAAAAAVSPDADVLQGAVVRVRARSLPPQPSERSLSGTEARQMPGAAGDVIRAVGALPGAVTPNDYLANLMVRGAGIEDNLILLDGLPVPYPFHFGGLESVFHAGLISQVLFLPGGFDARFGDTLGGVLDLHTKRPEEGAHG
ncbi:MAG TPA: TonB-dependent receptor plug domain-containing protein, partial [bacterium]|nr:TonB-dependent receptor plug domain-containing protein [bacterium]